jgi:glycine oxidase
MAVTLFDAGRLGGEASSAGAGMLAPGGEFDKPSHWLDLGIESMRLYPAFIEELQSEAGIPIDFRICGCVQLTSGEETRADFQKSAGIRVERTGEGLFYPGDGYVDPIGLLRALRCACEARRVQLRENHRVQRIESQDHSAIVIAAGAWSGQIRITHRGQIVSIPDAAPVKGHLLGFQMEPDSLPVMRRQSHIYVLQRSNGFTIAGSDEQRVGFDRSVDPAVCDDIHRRAARLFPAIADAKPVNRWIGFRPYSEGGPHVRRVEGTNVWLAYGHYRNGILLAPWTAQSVAGEIVDGEK